VLAALELAGFVVATIQAMGLELVLAPEMKPVLGLVEVQVVVGPVQLELIPSRAIVVEQSVLILVVLGLPEWIRRFLTIQEPVQRVELVVKSPVEFLLSVRGLLGLLVGQFQRQLEVRLVVPGLFEREEEPGLLVLPVFVHHIWILLECPFLELVLAIRLVESLLPSNSLLVVVVVERHLAIRVPLVLLGQQIGFVALVLVQPSQPKTVV
jgi:hypothetical protein